MRRRATLALALTACLHLGSPGGASAEVCYGVTGSIESVNLSDTTQAGTLTLALSNAAGDLVFDQTGNLIATVTGGALGGALLSHAASFDDGSFVTRDDRVRISDVRALDARGLPCSYFVAAWLTGIANGTGWFAGVSRLDLAAEGYVALCAEGSGVADNGNELELSGELCLE